MVYILLYIVLAKTVALHCSKLVQPRNIAWLSGSKTFPSRQKRPKNQIICIGVQGSLALRQEKGKVTGMDRLNSQTLSPAATKKEKLANMISGITSTSVHGWMPWENYVKY